MKTKFLTPAILTPYFLYVAGFNLYVITKLEMGGRVPDQVAIVNALIQLPVALILSLIPKSGVGGIHYTNEIIIRESWAIVIACIAIVIFLWAYCLFIKKDT